MRLIIVMGMTALMFVVIGGTFWLMVDEQTRDYCVAWFQRGDLFGYAMFFYFALCLIGTQVCEGGDARQS